MASSVGSVRILGISCSPRAGKTTAAALAASLNAAREAAPDRVETDLIELAGLDIDGDVAAGLPLRPGRRDDFAPLAGRLADPAVGGIILGTPVYMGGPTALGKAFLDRWTVFRRDGFALRNKVGACLAVGGSRNGGQELAVLSVLVAMMYQEMILVGSGQPASHYGAALLNDGKDSVAGDEAGLGMARALGRRVAEVALRVRSA